VLTWRTADWQLVDRLDVNADATRYLDFSPDSGAMLRYSPSTGGVYRFEIWNYHRQRVERKLQVPSRRFVGGTLSRDGKWVAADQYLCSLETGELFEFSRQCQQLPTFTPNGKRMLYWETPQWFESGWGCLPAVPFFRHIPQLGGSRLVVLDVSQQRVLARSPWVGQHPFLYSTSGDGSRMIVGHFDSYLREHSTQFWEISVPPGANQ
jgi:hypothetical protein